LRERESEHAAGFKAVLASARRIGLVAASGVRAASLTDPSLC
jgi:hypothetical protein